MSRVPEFPAPLRLLHLPEIDSTNAEAMRRALAGDDGPLWIMADRQSAGRGRSGRAWESLPGNLFASLLITTSCPVAKAGELSLVAGVAAIDAIRKAALPHAIADLRLKWPNDILIGAAKAGGILIESSARGSRLLAVIGIGLNLASAPESVATAATSLARHGLTLSPRDALCVLAEAMSAWLDIWSDGTGFAAVRTAWLERAGPTGEPLSVHTGRGLVEGRFAGLDADGALLVSRADGEQLRFTFGDVSLAQAAGGDRVGGRR